MKAKEIQKKLQAILNKIESNTVSAWEDNLEETKEVVVTENFRGEEYNGWKEELKTVMNDLENQEQEVLVLFGDITFFNQERDGVEKAVVHEILFHAMYPSMETAQAEAEANLGKFDAYVIPSAYKGRIIFQK